MSCSLSVWRCWEFSGLDNFVFDLSLSRHILIHDGDEERRLEHHCGHHRNGGYGEIVLQEDCKRGMEVRLKTLSNILVLLSS